MKDESLSGKIEEVPTQEDIVGKKSFELGEV